MPIKIALAGNPNSGKTTLFNDLTGSSQYVGNWPGVTVEKKEGHLKKNKNITITDLPGIYSLSPYSLEEVISRDYLLNEKPDVIINLVDGTNLERNLYLTTQILEMGLPTVVALNMIDIVSKSGDKIDSKKIGASLGCPVVEISALKGTGQKELLDKALGLANKGQDNKADITYSTGVEDALSQVESLLKSAGYENVSRFSVVKLFERDEKAIEQFQAKINMEQLEKIIAACEETFDDDSESIIANERYQLIAKVVKNGVRKRPSSNLTTSDKIDKIVTNRFLALPIFAAIMFLIYFISVSTIGTIVTDWTNDTLFGEIIGGNVSNWLAFAGAAGWLQGLIVDGIIGGVGAVLGFVPQMFILFFFLAILEDCGYMARVAFIMDRIFRKFGLSGKSFIPMLIGSGCGVPGIMASRTIENDHDRKMTIMVTTFIPCGAKLPIIALFAGALFGGSPWVAPGAYFLGVVMIIISGIILKKTRLFAGDPAPFVMELPQYHMPAPKGVLLHMWERGKSFIIKAGTIIFISCGVIWFLQSFNWQFRMVDAEESILASIGNVIAPIFAPLGFGNWQSSVATITGLVAKENVVGTMGVLFGIADATESDPSLLAGITSMFTAVSAFSFMAFNLLCAPCFAAIGAIKREMGGWKWTGIAVGYQTLLAYIVAFIIYQLGSVFFLGNGFNFGTALAILFILAVVWLLFRKDKTAKLHYDPKKSKKATQS